MGNTSLSQIPVPNFYMNRTLYEMETFKVKKKKSYFKERDLFRQVKDLNLSNNPRLNLNKFEDFNKTKYIPPYRSKSNAKVETFRSNISHQDMEGGENKTQEQQQVFKIPKEITEFEKYEEYMKKHQAGIEHPDFVKSLRNNINTIIDRVNSNYEVDKWTASKKTVPEYLYNVNSRITNDNFYEQEPENESSNFQKTLQNKITSLKIDKKKKEKVLKTFIKNTETSTEKSGRTTKDKFYSINNTNNTLNMPNILPNSKTITQLNTFDNKIPTATMNNFNNTAGAGFNNTAGVGFNNTAGGGFNNTAGSGFNNTNNVGLNNSNGLNFVASNSTFGLGLTGSGYNKLSDSRSEFSQMRGEKISFRRKDKLEPGEIDPRNYNACHHRDIFCEKYNTYGGIFEKKGENEIKAFLK